MDLSDELKRRKREVILAHSMRALAAVLLVAAGSGAVRLLGEEKKAPENLTFTAKNGNVRFNHMAHAKAAKGDCKTCHDKLFKEDTKSPLNFKAGLHKPAEAAKTSCGGCHHPDGSAFETKGNCSKCHVKT